MPFDRHTLTLLVLRLAPLLLFAALVVGFGLLSDRFLTFANFRNILTQSTHVAVMAIGMTFVLLVRGVDLSVGSVMYLVAVVLGLYLHDLSLALSIPIIMGVGLAVGAVNAWFTTALRIAPFMVTLATLFIGRGLALHISETKMVFQSDVVQRLGRSSALGIPWAIWILAVVAVIAWAVLTQMPYGRQIYAVGADPDSAAKAGIRVRPIVFSVFCICSACAAIGALISVSQVGAASATFGYQSEFPLIAAAVARWDEPLRRVRRGVRQHLRGRPRTDHRERPRDAQRRSVSLPARQQPDHLRRGLGRRPAHCHG